MDRIAILIKRVKRKIGKIIFKFWGPKPLLVDRTIEEDNFAINSEDDIRREVGNRFL